MRRMRKMRSPVPHGGNGFRILAAHVAAGRGAAGAARRGLASCLQCRSCSQTCPAGVDVAGLIADLRTLLPRPVRITCPACGTPLLPADAEAYLSRAAETGFEGRLSYALLCPSCRRRAYARNNR